LIHKHSSSYYNINKKLESKADELKSVSDSLKLSNQNLESKADELNEANKALFESNHQLAQLNKDFASTNKRFAEVNDELAATNKELSLVNEKIKEQNMMQTQCINEAAHELRTPTHAILGYSELLLQMDQDDNMDYAAVKNNKEALEAIFRNAKRVQTLVEDILNAARIENSTINPDKETLFTHLFGSQ
jgi:signal transduction histidine kinase